MSTLRSANLAGYGLSSGSDPSVYSDAEEIDAAKKLNSMSLLTPLTLRKFEMGGQCFPPKCSSFRHPPQQTRDPAPRAVSRVSKSREGVIFFGFFSELRGFLFSGAVCLNLGGGR